MAFVCKQTAALVVRINNIARDSIQIRDKRVYLCPQISLQ